MSEGGEGQNLSWEEQVGADRKKASQELSDEKRAKADALGAYTKRPTYKIHTAEKPKATVAPSADEIALAKHRAKIKADQQNAHEVRQLRARQAMTTSRSVRAASSHMPRPISARPKA